MAFVVGTVIVAELLQRNTRACFKTKLSLLSRFRAGEWYT